MKSKTITSEKQNDFASSVKQASRDGYVVVPGTLVACSFERTPDTGYEKTQFKEGIRFYREFYFVQMIQEYESDGDK